MKIAKWRFIIPREHVCECVCVCANAFFFNKVLARTSESLSSILLRVIYCTEIVHEIEWMHCIIVYVPLLIFNNHHNLVVRQKCVFNSPFANPFILRNLKQGDIECFDFFFFFCNFFLLRRTRKGNTRDELKSSW